MEINMDPKYKQMLDDTFDAFVTVSNGEIVSLMHVQGDYTRYSKAAVELFGFPSEYIQNGAMDWNDYLHPEDRKRYMDIMMPLAAGQAQTYDLTYRVRVKTGEYVNFRAVGAVIRDESGHPGMIGGLLINQGVTANTDPVTVLRNRNGYIEDLGRIIKEGRPTVTLMTGISRFLEINQTYGYSYGNRVLQEIAWLIQETVKDRGKVYRTGNAEFSVLSDSIGRDEMAAIYDTLRIKLQRGILIDGVRNILIGNGGLISTDADDEGDAAGVFSCANYAYEESKQRMHGELVDFNGTINYEMTQKLGIVSEVRDAILDGCEGFSLTYRPFREPKSGRTIGAEAVVGWENERYGKVQGEQFLPVLERDFVFEELGDWMLLRAMQDGVKIHEKDPSQPLCIPISAVQVEDDYFADTVLRTVKQTGFSAERLFLRLSKDCRLINISHIREVIAKLRAQKIHIIIDDFGTGFDSVGFLKEVEADGVVLDRGLIEGIDQNEKDFHLIEHLTQMVIERVPYVTVKGIDSKELLEAVEKLPITSLQGDYIGDRLKIEEFIGTL